MKKILLVVTILFIVIISGCITDVPDEDEISNSGISIENDLDQIDSKSDEPIYDISKYSWSTMDKSPYGDKVSFATSTDLLTWKDSGKILAEHASVPDIVYRNDILYVYFVDFSVDGYPEKLGLITSNDFGKTWSERKFINIQGIGRKVAVDPSPYLLDNGQIRLFYYDIGEASNPQTKGVMLKNKIYSAVSDDGINFIEDEGIRFEYDGIYDPCVIKINDNLWRMYVGNHDGQKVFSATSTDGLNFNYEGIAYTGGAIPNVIYENEKYYLYTVGIGISVSNDGITFTNTGKNFNNGKLTADPGVVKINENNYIMVYKTKE